MSEDIHDEGLAGLEAALAKLAPRSPAFDRDRLLFRAGQESARRPSRLWPWATGLLGAVAAGLAALLVLRPDPQPIERVVHVPVKQEAPAVHTAAVPPVVPPAPKDSNEDSTVAAERARFGAYQLQREALRWGIDGLPSITAPHDDAGPDRGPPPLPVVPRYYELRVALNTGG